MEKKIWFKAKQYGWGWYPATKEGWAIFITSIILILLPNALVVFVPFNNERFNEFYANFITYGYVFYIILISLILIAICYKTGEKPEWRWGDKRKNEK